MASAESPAVKDLLGASGDRRATANGGHPRDGETLKLSGRMRGDLADRSGASRQAGRAGGARVHRKLPVTPPASGVGDARSP